jgi:hypothetical protein
MDHALRNRSAYLAAKAMHAHAGVLLVIARKTGGPLARGSLGRQQRGLQGYFLSTQPMSRRP